jgi:hypothetical protein
MSLNSAQRIRALTLSDVFALDLWRAAPVPLLRMADEPAGDAESLWREEAAVVGVCDLPDLAEDEGWEGRVRKEGDGEVARCECTRRVSTLSPKRASRWTELSTPSCWVSAGDDEGKRSAWDARAVSARAG